MCPMPLQQSPWALPMRFRWKRSNGRLTTFSGQRQNILKIHGYTVIDDAYNASPDSMKAGLKILFHDYKDSGRKSRFCPICWSWDRTLRITTGKSANFWARQILRYCTSPEPFPKNMQKLHKKESLTKNEMVFLQ